MNQIKNGRGYDNDLAKLSRAPDGTTPVTITPLLTGQAHFDLVTTLTNHRFAVQSISLNLAGPTRTPLQFLADQTCKATVPNTCVSHMHVGMQYTLWPLLTLRAAPEKSLSVGQFSSYSALQDAASPVIDLDAGGAYKALREGRATIIVSYSSYQSRTDIVVDQSFPLMIHPVR